MIAPIRRGVVRLSQLSGIARRLESAPRRPIVRDRLPFARLQKMMTNLVVEAKRCPIWFTHLKPTPFAFDIVGLVE